jgi:hypothetical protein
MLGKLCALAVAFCALVGVANAQEASGSHEFGRRMIGGVHRANLSARNASCPQQLDFRFEFAPSPWLRPAGEPRVRNVPTGESRPIPLIIDLTQMPVGRHTADVDIICENCRQFFLLTNCRFDRQHLTLAVEAIEAPAEPAPAPTVTAPPRPTRPTPPASTPEPESQAPVLDQTSPPPIETATAQPAPEVAAACDCAAQTSALTAAALIAGLAALGFAAWGFSAARTASALAKSGAEAAQRAAESAKPDSAASQPDIEELKELLNGSRDDLTKLLRTQFRAMRALSRLGAADPATLAPQADAWTRICQESGHAVSDAGDAVIAGRGAKSLAAALEGGAAPSGQELFASFAAASQHRQRLDWLRAEGLADTDADAQAVLTEMSNFAAHGSSMSDMNERLQEALNECRKAETELARALAGMAGGG